MVTRSVELNIGVSPRNQVSNTVKLLVIFVSMCTWHFIWRDLPISAYSTGGAEMVIFGVGTVLESKQTTTNVNNNYSVTLVLIIMELTFYW